jgi:hypothetical protein
MSPAPSPSSDSAGTGFFFGIFARMCSASTRA